MKADVTVDFKLMKEIRIHLHENFPKAYRETRHCSSREGRKRGGGEGGIGGGGERKKKRSLNSFSLTPHAGTPAPGIPSKWSLLAVHTKKIARE